MARFQVKKTQEGPALSWGFLRRMGPRRTDSSPWRPEESLICGVSGGRLGTEHSLPPGPSPTSPPGNWWVAGLAGEEDPPHGQASSLHASTHPATNSSPLTTSPAQFPSHPSIHPAKPTFHHSTLTSTSTHHPLIASFYQTIHPSSTYLHTNPSIQTSSQLLTCSSSTCHSSTQHTHSR